MITINGHTQKQPSEGLADWNGVRKAIALSDSLKSETLIHGNGDIFSYEKGIVHALRFKVEGIMTGRGIFNNP